MRAKHITGLRTTRQWLLSLVLLACLLSWFNLTCNGDDGPSIPGPEPFDPLRPTIESITAQRDGEVIDDGIVFSGEDISLTVQATSHAFPQSCGLQEGETVQDNLLYTFQSLPPENVLPPGVLSQSAPPDNRAIWRVPILDDYDRGEGILYRLMVTVFDECLGRQASGSITLRAFANQGPPIIADFSVMSGIGTTSPVTEELDQNGYYEVERGDTCRITVTARSRTSSEVCANRGVSTGDEIAYAWQSSFSVINLSFDQDPTRAYRADFDIPVTVGIGDTFMVSCDVLDRCTGTETRVDFRFYVVAPPRITSLGGTANGISLTFDPYFDNYEVLPADKVVLTATALVGDEFLCDLKGISPELEWTWEELTGSTPAIAPWYDPLPVPYDTSTIEFVVPAALNGTEYSFRCSIADRCNGLTDTETADFLVIVPPDAEIAHVMAGTAFVTPSQETGRYRIGAGDLVTIRVTAAAKSSAGFCEARGISRTPPVQYYWVNPWEDVIYFNYQELPDEEYCDLVVLVPTYVHAMEIDLTCRVKDICNELVTEVVVPIEVIN